VGRDLEIPIARILAPFLAERGVKNESAADERR